MKVEKDLINKLNTLLARSRDAREGYLEASQKLNGTGALYKWMHEYSDQRLHFSIELEREIRILGGNPDFDTSVLGELHRMWMDIKGSFSDNEPLAMLEECHRGESKAFDDYEEILNDYPNMPTTTRTMLTKQQSKIKGAIAQIETMTKTLEAVES